MHISKVYYPGSDPTEHLSICLLSSAWFNPNSHVFFQSKPQNNVKLCCSFIWNWRPGQASAKPYSLQYFKSQEQPTKSMECQNFHTDRSLSHKGFHFLTEYLMVNIKSKSILGREKGALCSQDRNGGKRSDLCNQVFGLSHVIHENRCSGICYRSI